MANFNNNQLPYGSRTVPRGGMTMSSSQLEDAVYAARVLGLSNNLTTDLMRSTSSNTIPSIVSGSSLGTSALGKIGLQPKSGIGLLPQQPQLGIGLGLMPQVQQQLAQQISRAVPSSASYDDIGGRRRDSGRGYNDDQGGYRSPEGSRRKDNRSPRREEKRSPRERSREANNRSDRGYRSPPRRNEGSFERRREDKRSPRRREDKRSPRRQEDKRSPRRQHESRSSRDPNRDSRSSPGGSSAVYDAFYDRKSGGAENSAGNRAGGRNSRRQNRGQKKQNQNQNGQQEQKRIQAQIAQAQAAQAHVAQTQEIQLQAQLQTQQQLQETLQRLHQLEASQQKKDMEMQEMADMLRSKRKMDDDMDRMDIKQRRLDREMGLHHDPYSPPFEEPLPPLRSPSSSRRDRDRGSRSDQSVNRNRKTSATSAGRGGDARGQQGSNRSGQQASSANSTQQISRNRGVNRRGRGYQMRQQLKKQRDRQRQQQQRQKPQESNQGIQQQQKGSQQQKDRLCCYKCGKEGHKKNECTEQSVEILYPTELIEKHGLRNVENAYDTEMELVRKSQLQLDLPEPMNKDSNDWLCCYKCGQEGHTKNKCTELTSKQTHVERGEDVSDSTVSHQVTLLKEMHYGIHIHDKKLRTLTCYICNIKCKTIEEYYYHLEGKTHKSNVSNFNGAVGDPGRVNLAKQLCHLPSVYSKHEGDKAEEDYSFLCRVCMIVVPGPIEKHQEVKVHKHKEVHKPRCVTCRLFFAHEDQLKKHDKSVLHNKMRRESQRKQPAKKEKTQSGKETSEQEKKRWQENPKASQGSRKSKTVIPPGAILGLDLVIPGWFCKACQKFGSIKTKEEHCAESNHHKKILQSCKKKNMTTEMVLKTYMENFKSSASDQPSISEEDQGQMSVVDEVGDEEVNVTDMETTKDDSKPAEESDTKDSSGDKVKSSDVQMSEDTDKVEDIKMEGVVEMIQEGDEDEDVDINDDEMEEDSTRDLTDPEGHKMGDDDQGEDVLGEDLDGDDDDTDVDDIILEDTSAQVTEDTKPDQSKEEIEEQTPVKEDGKDGDTAPKIEENIEEAAPDAGLDVKDIATVADNQTKEEAEEMTKDGEEVDAEKMEEAPEVKKTPARASRRAAGRGKAK